MYFVNANIFLELQLDQQRADCIKELAPTTDPLKLKKIWQLAEKQN